MRFKVNKADVMIFFKSCLLWFISVAVLTFIVSERVMHVMVQRNWEWLNTSSMIFQTRMDEIHASADDVAEAHQQMTQLRSTLTQVTNTSRFAFDWTRSPLLRNTESEADTAMVVTDAGGHILWQSESILTIDYITEQQAHDAENFWFYTGFIAVEHLEPQMRTFLLTLVDNVSVFEQMKMQGYFDGAEFFPNSIYTTMSDVRRRTDIRSGRDSFSIDPVGEIGFLTRNDLLEWDLIFAAEQNGDDLETIYIFRYFESRYTPGSSLRVNSNRYGSISELLEDNIAAGVSDGLHGLTDAARIRRWSLVMDAWQVRYFAPTGDFITPDYHLFLAIRQSPMQHAMQMLIHVYIASFLIMLILTLFSRRNMT